MSLRDQLLQKVEGSVDRGMVALANLDDRRLDRQALIYRTLMRLSMALVLVDVVGLQFAPMSQGLGVFRVVFLLALILLTSPLPFVADLVAPAMCLGKARPKLWLVEAVCDYDDVHEWFFNVALVERTVIREFDLCIMRALAARRQTEAERSQAWAEAEHRGRMLGVISQSMVRAVRGRPSLTLIDGGR
jgi:hypothetical protein